MKITGIDKDKSGFFEGADNRYLTTDEPITDEWVQMFREKVSPSFTVMNPNISVVENFIVVNCDWQDLQAEINKLQTLCAATDAALIKKHLEAEKEAEEKRWQEEIKKSRAYDFYDNLKF